MITEHYSQPAASKRTMHQARTTSAAAPVLTRFSVVKGPYNGECADYHALIHPLNQYGIHARPAALIVQAAAKFDCDCYLLNLETEEKVSAKSIMGVMTLEASRGTPLLAFTNEGHNRDAQACLEKIVGLFNDQFGEE